MQAKLAVVVAPLRGRGLKLFLALEAMGSRCRPPHGGVD